MADGHWPLAFGFWLLAVERKAGGNRKVIEEEQSARRTVQTFLVQLVL